MSVVSSIVGAVVSAGANSLLQKQQSAKASSMDAAQRKLGKYGMSVMAPHEGNETFAAKASTSSDPTKAYVDLFRKIGGDIGA